MLTVVHYIVINDWVVMRGLAGLCPDWSEWNPNNNEPNAEAALGAAEKWLDGPQVAVPPIESNIKRNTLL